MDTDACAESAVFLTSTSRVQCIPDAKFKDLRTFVVLFWQQYYRHGIKLFKLLS